MDAAAALRESLAGMREERQKTSALLGGIFESFGRAGKMPWLQRRRATPLQRGLFQAGYWGVPVGIGLYAGEKTGLLPRLRGEVPEGEAPQLEGVSMQQSLQRIQNRTQGAP